MVKAKVGKKAGVNGRRKGALVLEADPSVELTEVQEQTLKLLEIFDEARDAGVMESLRAQAELTLEDVGWKTLGESVTGYDLTTEVRKRSVKMSREMVIKNPLCGHAVWLWTSFGVEDGIRLTTPKVAANRRLEELWKSEKNSTVLGDEGQRRSSNRLLVDGELFFLIKFTDEERVPRIQRVSTLEMVDLFSTPGDEDDVIAYKRRVPRAKIATTGVRRQEASEDRYYWDWRSAGRNGEKLQLIEGQGDKDTPVTVRENEFIYHVKVNGFGLRGNPILTSVLSWAQAHVKFMEARVNIQRMIAMFAMKARVKGTSRSLAALKQKMASTLTATNPETNPAPVTGSMWFENEGVDLQAMKMETGAASAAVDGAMIMTVFALGVRLYPHFFGVVEGMDAGTAEAVGVPLVKGFAAYQEMWGQVYTEMSLFILRQTRAPGAKDLQINVDFPELVNKDRAGMVEALSRIFAVAPWLMEVDEVVKITLTQLGVKDTEAVWARVGDEVKKRVREFVEAMTQKQAQGMQGRDPRNQMVDRNQNRSGGEGPTTT